MVISKKVDSITQLRITSLYPIFRKDSYIGWFQKSWCEAPNFSFENQPKPKLWKRQNLGREGGLNLLKEILLSGWCPIKHIIIMYLVFRMVFITGTPFSTLIVKIMKSMRTTNLCSNLPPEIPYFYHDFSKHTYIG